MQYCYLKIVKFFKISNFSSHLFLSAKTLCLIWLNILCNTEYLIQWICWKCSLHKLGKWFISYSQVKMIILLLWNVYTCGWGASLISVVVVQTWEWFDVCSMYYTPLCLGNFSRWSSARCWWKGSMPTSGYFVSSCRRGPAVLVSTWPVQTLSSSTTRTGIQRWMHRHRTAATVSDRHVMCTSTGQTLATFLS